MDKAMRSREQIARSAAAAVRDALGTLGTRHAMVGFDGFIDVIIRVVDRRRSMAYDDYESIRTIDAFAKRIAAAAGKSANLELVTLEQRFGGNGPLLAGALGRLGFSVDYIGAVGREDEHTTLHPIYEPLAARCRNVFPIAPPSITEALEFDDGKIMLGHARNATGITWDRIKHIVGLERLRTIVAETSLIGIVNWTMVGGVEEIWTGLCDEILTQGSDRRMLIDLSDPAKRSDDELGRGLGVLSRLASFGRLTLGLNLAEAQRLARVLGIEPDNGTPIADDDALSRASAIRASLGIECVVVHRRDGAAAASRCGSALWFDGPFTRNPVLSTGAGDHFNAGFALGQLLELDIAQCLAIACATSGLYVREAASPTAERLAAFLEDLPMPETVEHHPRA